MSTLATLLLLAVTSDAGARPPIASVGEMHRVSKSYETSEQSSEGSSGSSRGRDVLMERVISAGDEGLVLEFDLPDAKPEDRARNWQFPVRVLWPESGPMQVLNWPELDKRLDAWLAAAGMTRAQCGQWIFTWNAFRIDCDPASVISLVEGFSPGRAGLREGDRYEDEGAKAPGILERSSAGSDSGRLSVVLDIDPDKVRRARAESDVIVGGIMGRQVNLDSALLERSDEAISGTITISIDTDAAGMPWRRIRVTELKIKSRDGVTESKTVTETLERQLYSGAQVLAVPAD